MSDVATAMEHNIALPLSGLKCVIPSMKKNHEKIVIPSELNVWPHELKTARALAATGRVVEFIPKSNIAHQRTADVLIDGQKWEFKAPTANNLKAIERNLKRGRWQSSNIIFDSRRMKTLPDKVILREVTKQSSELSGIARLLYVDKHGQVIDVK